MMQEWSLREFCAALASSQPTPGGGPASAAVGAQAAALAEMVAQITRKNKKFVAVHAEMDAISARCADLRAELLAAMERDAAAFAELMRCWRLLQEDPAREEQLTRATYAAAEAPLAIARTAARIFPEAAAVLRHGTPAAASDGALAVLFAAAAIRGALYNVRINLAALAPTARAEELAAAAEELETAAAEEERRLLPLAKI